MAVLVAVEQVTKQFPLAGGNSYLALQGINLEIQRGEFTVYLSIKGYKKPPSFSRLRIIDSRQVGFNCIP
jgi:ABC-type nitrate/sulfonate/bicarbonate transport system ATPase subunit